MNTQTAGYQNKLLGAVAQTDYTGGFVCLWRRLRRQRQRQYHKLKIWLVDWTRKFRCAARTIRTGVYHICSFLDSLRKHQ